MTDTAIPMTAGDATLRMRVQAIADEAPDVRAIELRACDGQPLPAFTAGAHIDVRTGSGIVRSYSLLNSQDQRDRYVIGVYRDPDSRGGSRWLHDQLAAGDVLEVGPPRNDFALCESAGHSVLIAGGIGITPILSMVRRLQAIGRSWQVVYAVRSRSRAAFLEPLRELAAGDAGRLQLHVDEEEGGRLLDLASLVASAPPGTHFYSCGPGPMLEAYKRATASLPPEQVHLEYFGADVAPAAGGFAVVLAKSGRKVPVPAGISILAALGAAGVYVPRVCEQGVCGTCETKVLAGVPDHRDLFLTPTEQAAGKTILICCSGSLTDELVLDL